MQLVFRFCHVVEQKFQYQRTAQTPALDLEVGKSHRHIDILNVPDADKPRIFHRLREAVAFLRTRCVTDVVRADFAEIFSADILIAALSVPASDPAALVAEKFHLVFLRLRQTVQLSKGFVQPEVRHHIAELFPGRLRPELLKLCQHFRRGGHEIKLRIVCFQVVQQQLRVDDDAALYRVFLLKQGAEGVALFIRKVFLPEERVAEGQPRRDAVFPRQGKDFFGVMLPEAGPSPAPDAVGRCAVDGADIAPVIKVFSVRPEQGQELPVQLVELEQSGQMIVSFFLFHFSLFLMRFAS